MFLNLTSISGRIFQFGIATAVFILVVAPQTAMQQYDRDIAVFQSKTFFEITEGKGWDDISCQKLSTSDVQLQIKCKTAKHQEEILGTYVSILNTTINIAATVAVIFFIVFLCSACATLHQFVTRTSKG